MEIKKLKNSFLNISKNIYDSEFINLANIKKGKISFDEKTLFLNDDEKNKLNNEKIEKKEDVIYLYEYENSYGVVADLVVDEYKKEKIRTHELIIPERVQGMISNFYIYNSETAPVSIIYEKDIDIKKIIDEKKYIEKYDFGKIKIYIYEKEEADKILQLFKDIDHMYIADGHHRLMSASMLKNKDTILASFISLKDASIKPIHRAFKEMDDKKFEKAKNFMQKFMEIKSCGNDEKVKKGYVKIIYKDQNYIVKLKSTEEDLFWDNDVYRLNTQIINTAFRILDYSKIEYILDKDFSDYKKNVNENTILFELSPIKKEEFLKLGEKDAILPPKSTCFLPKFPSFLILKKYRRH